MAFKSLKVNNTVKHNFKSKYHLKSILALVLVSVLLTACGNNSTDSNTELTKKDLEDAEAAIQITDEYTVLDIQDKLVSYMQAAMIAESFKQADDAAQSVKDIFTEYAIQKLPNDMGYKLDNTEYTAKVEDVYYGAPENQSNGDINFLIHYSYTYSSTGATEDKYIEFNMSPQTHLIYNYTIF